jgi:apolipoprotein N-acyltransferase
MFSVISTVTKHCLTGIDGESYDIARVLWAIGTFVFIALTCWQTIYRGEHFDYIQWATGFAGVMAACSAAVRIKAMTEPTSSS